jgi:hypothetical protein
MHIFYFPHFSTRTLVNVSEIIIITVITHIALFLYSTIICVSFVYSCSFCNWPLG